MRPPRSLAAPPGYRWTDPEVLSEKRDSWYDGLSAGLIVGCLLAMLVYNFAAALL